MDLSSLFSIAFIALSIIAIVETIAIIVILFKFRLTRKT
jgi:hypothetical protein